MIFKEIIDKLKNDLLKDGLEGYINALTFFSDGIYGTYREIWGGFYAGMAKGGENTKEDARRISQKKFYFEYTYITEIKKEDILNLPNNRAHTFLIYDKKREPSLDILQYIKYIGNMNPTNN